MHSTFLFTKENVDRREQEIMQQMRSAYGRSEAPFTRNVRARTDWERLYDAFPAPITPQLRMDRLMEPIRAKYDCHLEPSLKCNCYKCQTVMQNEINYFNLIQESNALNCTPPVGVIFAESMCSDRVVELVSTPEFTPCIAAHSVGHFYKCEPTWDRSEPRTPWFSEVNFSPLEQEEISPRKRWVKYRRTVVTPTQLIFKKN
jgi:hypothetical protein